MKKDEKNIKICIIDGGYWVGAIKESIKAKNVKIDSVKLKDISRFDFKKYDGIVISGSTLMLTEMGREKAKKVFGFLNKIKIPILGICFGHQLFGFINDSSIGHGNLVNKKEKINFVQSDPLFKGVKNHSLFRDKHYEYISVPKNFILLAKSASCQNEAMRHKTKNIYCTQFHPEVSGKNGKRVFKNFLNLCDNTVTKDFSVKF
jgi:GMP synthase (glutamine-hydrolysing)